MKYNPSPQPNRRDSVANFVLKSFVGQIFRKEEFSALPAKKGCAGIPCQKDTANLHCTGMY
jgi:hypothetical protein